MLHLYCIVPAGHPVPDDRTGLESRRPFAVKAGDIAVWATEHDAPVTPSIEVVRAHNELVAAGMTPDVTPVPLRFGQTVRDRDAAIGHIAGDAAKWLDQLQRFAGHAEFGVRAVREIANAEQDVRVSPPESGTEYMAALARKQSQEAARRAEAERIAEMLRSAAAPVAADVRVEYAKGSGVLVAVASLVAWKAVDAYHGAIREVCDASQDTRFVMTGPWPPYSFVA